MAPGQLVGPIRDHQQQRKGGQLPCKEAEQIETGLIGPMQILQHRDHGPGGADCGEDVEHLAEQGDLAAGFRVAGVGQRGRQRGKPVYQMGGGPAARARGRTAG